MCSRQAYVSYFTLDFEKKEVYTMYIHCVFYAWNNIRKGVVE